MIATEIDRYDLDSCISPVSAPMSPDGRTRSSDVLHMRPMRLTGRATMRRAVSAIAFGYSLSCCTPYVSAALPNDSAVAVTNVGACERHLASLVTSLQNSARQEGRALSLESRANATMLLHYEHFTQRIRCRDGVLHADIE